MDVDYYKIVTITAVERLSQSKKPLSENEFTRGLVASLKKKHGKDDLRHSSKIRFRKEIFKYIVETPGWKNEIVQINNKKFALKSWVPDLPPSNTDPDFDWHNVPLEIAEEKVLKLLKKTNPFKLEELIAKMIERMYGYKAEVTRKTGDMGIDVICYKDDFTTEGKKQAMYIQVKGFEGTVGRDNADKFIGAVKEYYKKEKWSKFDGLFITTGKFPPSFQTKLENSSETGINFFCWDGKKLVKNLIGLGWGINYSIDLNFWNDSDSTLIPKR
jgi:hypothetical protein